MRKSLDEIHELLDEFEMELSKIRAIWRQIEIDNPDFEQVSEENRQINKMRSFPMGCAIKDIGNILSKDMGDIIQGHR